MRRLIFSLLLCAVCPTSALAADIFVNNLAGNDRFNGARERPDRNGGPCQTISKALLLARKGDRIVIANTGRPYHECLSVQAGNNSGLPGEPLRLEGNGAVIDGSLPVPDEAWQHFRGDVHRFRPRKMSHQVLFQNDKPLERVPTDRTLLEPRPLLKPLQWCLFQGHVYFCCEPNRSPWSYALTHTALPTGITLYEVRGVRIQDLVVQGFAFDGVNAHDSAMDVDLIGLTVRGNGRGGIAIGGSSQVRISSCLVGANGESQVRIRDFTRVLIYNSRLVDSPSAPGIDRVGGWLDYEPLKEEAAAARRTPIYTAAGKRRGRTPVSTR